MFGRMFRPRSARSRGVAPRSLCVRDPPDHNRIRTRAIRSKVDRGVQAHSCVGTRLCIGTNPHLGRHDVTTHVTAAAERTRARLSRKLQPSRRYEEAKSGTAGAAPWRYAPVGSTESPAARQACNPSGCRRPTPAPPAPPRRAAGRRPGGRPRRDSRRGASCRCRQGRARRAARGCPRRPPPGSPSTR